MPPVPAIPHFLRRLAIVLLCSLAGELVLIPAIWYHFSDGFTLCSVDGHPRIFVDTSLDPALRRATIVHESVHAAQCRAEGGLRFYWGLLSPEGALKAELGAFCAEAEMVATTEPPEALMSETTDALWRYPAVVIWYGWRPETLRSIAERECLPMLRRRWSEGQRPPLTHQGREGLH